MDLSETFGNVVRDVLRIELDNRGLHIDNIVLRQNDDEILSIEEAAALLKLTRQTLYKKVAQNEIPFFKIDGAKRVYFLKSVLVDFVRENRIPTLSERVGRK